MIRIIIQKCRRLTTHPVTQIRCEVGDARQADMMGLVIVPVAGSVYSIVLYELQLFPVLTLVSLPRIDLHRWPNSSAATNRNPRVYQPGEPANSERAGITVFGGTMVLSAILAQSLMIVNFPWSNQGISGQPVLRVATQCRHHVQ